jgi:hypothetical protein
MTQQMFLYLILIFREDTLQYVDGFSKRAIHITPIEWSNQAAIVISESTLSIESM